MRIYDLKGSTFQRQVQKKNKSINLFQKVLKDTDFINQERKIMIS